MANPIKVIKLTGVSGSLEGKADAIHTHELADITDAGTAASADITDFAPASQGTLANNAIQAGTLASINADISDATLIDTTDPRLSDSRTPTTHSHTLSQITDSGSAANLDVATVGNAADGEVVTGDDTRLSDDRDPTAHTHTLSDILDSGTAASEDTTAFATSAQGILATTALQDPTAFATSAQGELASTAVQPEDIGTAASAEVSDFATSAQGELASTSLQDASAFAPATHTHSLSEITDNNIVTRTTDESATGNAWVLNETTFTSNSSTKVPTQSSVKSYVDNAVSEAQLATPFKGAYNPVTNTPDLTSPTAIPVSAGDTFIIDNAGSFYGRILESGTTIIAEGDTPNELSDWTVVEGSLNNAAVKSAYEANLDTNAFTDADQTKLDAIEDNATADQTGAEIKLAYEANLDTNAFTDADQTKLDAIETAATADQTGAEIKALYESQPKAFTNTSFNKLASVEDNATEDQTGAEIKALYELETNTNAFTDDDLDAVNEVKSGNYTRNDQLSVISNGWVLDDATMATASSATLPTSNSVKEFVEASLQSDLMNFKGAYSPTTNSPSLDGLVSGTLVPVNEGDVYVFSSEGAFWGENLKNGTLVIASQDNPTDLTGWAIISGGQVELALSELTDVSEAEATANFVLVADGSQYTGKLLTLDQLGDVETTTLVTGEFLQWDGESWINQDPSQIGSSVTVTGSEAPASPQSGDLWFNNETASLSVYYVDNDSSQWVSIRGQSGPVGPAGPEGSTGPVGPSGGPEGPIGKSLLYGDTVPSSLTGREGEFYIHTDTQELYGPKIGPNWGTPISIVGQQGPIGATGTTGPQGDTGPQGETGDTGPTGPQGNEGPEGPQGNTGARGLQGATGQDGKSLNFAGVVSSVGDLPVNAVNGDLYIAADTGEGYLSDGANGWTDTGQIRGPEGPEGPEGPIGITGNQGPQGATGADGTSVNLQGAVTTFTSLPSGASEGDLYITSDTSDGWVSDGNNNWENVGPIQGPQGATGPEGLEGPVGPRGPQGTAGLNGSTGDQGPEGPEGPEEPEGPEGPKGDQGIQGISGLDGTNGTNGIQGPEGPEGPQGPEGPEGPQGDAGIEVLSYSGGVLTITNPSASYTVNGTTLNINL